MTPVDFGSLILLGCIGFFEIWIISNLVWHDWGLKKIFNRNREFKRARLREVLRTVEKQNEAIEELTREKYYWKKRAVHCRWSKEDTLGHLSPYKQESEMDYRQYAGIMGNNTSKWFDTEEKAVAWGKEQMNSRNVDKVIIVKSISVLKRPVPAVDVLPLMNKEEETQTPLHNQEQIAEKQNGGFATPQPGAGYRHPTSGVHDNGYDFTGRDMEQANPSNRT